MVSITKSSLHNKISTWLHRQQEDSACKLYSVMQDPETFSNTRDDVLSDAFFATYPEMQQSCEIQGKMYNEQIVRRLLNRDLRIWGTKMVWGKATLVFPNRISKASSIHVPVKSPYFREHFSGIKNLEVLSYLDKERYSSNESSCSVSQESMLRDLAKKKGIEIKSDLKQMKKPLATQILAAMERPHIMDIMPREASDFFVFPSSVFCCPDENGHENKLPEQKVVNMPCFHHANMSLKASWNGWKILRGAKDTNCMTTRFSPVISIFSSGILKRWKNSRAKGSSKKYI